MPPSSDASCSTRVADELEVGGVDDEGHVAAVDQVAQRAAGDVEHALGLDVERPGDDLLGEAQGELDGVLLEPRRRAARAARRPRRTAAASAASAGCGARLGGGQAGGAALGLAGGAGLGADLLGLGPDGRQHVGDVPALAPPGGASSWLEGVAGHGRRGRLRRRGSDDSIFFAARERRARRPPRAGARSPRSGPGPPRPRACAAAAGTPSPRPASRRRARTCCRGSVLDVVVDAAQGQRQVLLVGLAQDHLDRAVVELDDVLEDEQQAADLGASSSSVSVSESSTLRSVERSAWLRISASDLTPPAAEYSCWTTLSSFWRITSSTCLTTSGLVSPIRAIRSAISACSALGQAATAPGRRAWCGGWRPPARSSAAPRCAGT